MNPSKSFPIEQSYINLSIVETKEQQDKEKKLLDPKLYNEIIGTYEEIYGMKAKIEIKDLFENNVLSICCLSVGNRRYLATI
jgi:hypothetical protein